MWFSQKEPDGIKKLFLFKDPFIVDDNEINRLDYELNYFDDQSRVDEEKLQSFLFKFAVDEGLVIGLSENKTTPAITTNTGSWIWIVNHMNFRSLVDLEQYSTLMSSIQANNSYPINQILDLHVRLGALFENHVLNTIVHRTMTSISLLPYDLSKTSQTIEWERIHKETPFVWLIILIQIIIRTTSLKALAV